MHNATPNHYFSSSPYGMQMPGRHFSSADSHRYGFQGMEADEEIKGAKNSYDFGARIYDPRVCRWLSRDPLEAKYPNLNPYNFVANTPLRAIDPDGMRIYFIGGAGNDTDGWDYVPRFIEIFSKNFMEVQRVNASNGQLGDMAFSLAESSSPWITERQNASMATGQDLTNPNDVVIKRRVASVKPMVKKAVEEIMADLEANPIENGETFDLMGYSYGSVMQAHVALALADRGIKVDNLVLIGSPIDDDSELFKALEANENIGNVIRHDIEGDYLSNTNNLGEFIIGGAQNSVNSGPHFDLARPGKEADAKIGSLAKDLRHQGVGKPASGTVDRILYDTSTQVEQFEDQQNSSSGN